MIFPVFSPLWASPFWSFVQNAGFQLPHSAVHFVWLSLYLKPSGRRYTEKKQQGLVPLSWDHSFSIQRESFPSLRILVVRGPPLPILSPWNCLGAAAQESGKKKKKPKGFPSTLANLGIPFPALDQVNKRASPRAFSVWALAPTSEFCTALGLGYRRGKKRDPHCLFGLFPYLPTTVYFSESSNSYSMHSVQML